MPFTKFSIKKLEAFLCKHPVSKKGRKYIDKALAVPSRNVSGTTNNVISDIPCPKMGWNSQTESWRTERPFTLKNIFDLHTIGYAYQPPQLELIYKGRNNRTVRTRYTPDNVRFDINLGCVIEEWKSPSDKESLLDKYPGRYVRNNKGVYSSPVISDLIEPWGFKFSVRFSDEISEIAQRNRIYLFTYLQPKAKKIYGYGLKKLLSDYFTDVTSESYEVLIHKGANIDILNWAIANAYLYIDFDTGPITSYPSRVLVFRHEESLDAWRLAVRPSGVRPQRASVGDVSSMSPGMSFVLDGIKLTVRMVGRNNVYAYTERKEEVTLSIHNLAKYCCDGTAVLPENLSSGVSNSRFWFARPKDLNKAIKKYNILNKLTNGEALDNNEIYSDSTYRRWRKEVEIGRINGVSAIEALLEYNQDKGFRGPHVENELSRFLDNLIDESQRDNKNKTIISAYYEIKEKVEVRGFRMIVKSSFYERYHKRKTISDINEVQGHKASKQLEPTYWMLNLETPVHEERAFELVHFDSTLLDIELCSSLSGEVLGRPWLSLAMCACTRKVLGMYLSFAPPSYVSTMMLLADIVRRHGRLPEAIIHDWGSEFKAKDWKMACTSLEIIIHVRPKSSARFGAILERMFGCVTKELLDNIAGNTKIRKNVRQLSPKVDPSVHSGLWLADLFVGLEEYFFKIHNHTKHPATFRTPSEAAEASLLKHGYFLHRLRRYEDILPILMPMAKGSPRRIDPTRGIYVNYRYYGHPDIAKLYLKGRPTIVKPVLFDPGLVLAFVKDQWIICKSKIHSDLLGAPEFVRQCLFEEYRLEQRLIEAAKDGKREKIRYLMDELNRKAIENKDYWRDREARDLNSMGSFNLPNAEDLEEDAFQRIDGLMQNAISEVFNSGINTVLAR